MLAQTRTEPEVLLNDLEKAKKLRQEFSGNLNTMADTLNQAEIIGEEASGKLGLERDISDLNIASNNLRDGVFRLLVLGDMKRGKSTFLNALIGEKVLPADVNPCTAVLTILRYGQQKAVTVYFNDGTTEKFDFDTFKRCYTIPPAEAKKLEEEGRQAFPNVDYAVVEYPLDILEKGVEIIDSPGLNDTESRNNLTLSYIQNCHVILFVLSATQPCTLGERRYLENYIKDRGLTVFFLVNQWDRVRESLVDPDDIQELREAEEKLHQVFKSNLFEYCQVEGQNLYDKRVFELSSLEALRRQLKQLSLEGTGFSEFMEALNTFLTKERIVAELRQARTLARQTYVHIHEAIERRLPLLNQDIEDLKQKIKSVQPEFNSLTQIRDAFKDEIRRLRDYYANLIADSFHDYILNLDTTFEEDFKPYQPDLKVLDFVKQNKRQEFEEAIKQGFEKYINDKIAAWSRGAEQDMNEAFKQLAVSALNMVLPIAKSQTRLQRS
ncbi:dynamin family protein [Gloeocapsopsis dulcis]|nr:dynamin family protein [Gloeocapsopsis dulcis]WNN89900.1 dynamin family protein [Gloeocapsopsis dulcis]